MPVYDGHEFALGDGETAKTNLRGHRHQLVRKYERVHTRKNREVIEGVEATRGNRINHEL